jgi:hypothetical protein
VAERPLAPAALLDRIVTALEAAGLRDDGRVALDIVTAVQLRDTEPAQAAAAVPRSFLAKNGIGKNRLAELLTPVLEGVTLREDRGLLIPIVEIDTFARAAATPTTAVAATPFPLPLAERDVKHELHAIVGEPFVDEDWGGELADVYTTRVRLGGREVQSAFLLKGRGLGRKSMRVRDLGKNGDQIVRLSKLPAELFVVQYVGAIEEAVRTHLRQAVALMRASGSPNAVGSVWDGADTARLFLSHGRLDALTGTFI